MTALKAEPAEAPPPPERTGPRNFGGYVGAFDGMRGIGLVAVLLYHGGYTILPGAFFSISMFFTLSGFLITMLMIKEVARSDRIALGAFWLRRARRLLPAALFTLLGILLLHRYFTAISPSTAAGRRARRTRLRGELVADPHQPGLRRDLLGGLAGPALLVARDRGAVLPVLPAAHGGALPRLRPQPAHRGRARVPHRGELRLRGLAQLEPRPRLLQHLQPRVGDPRRHPRRVPRRAVRPRPHGEHAPHHRRGRRRRHRRHGVAVVVDRPARPVRVPRRHAAQQRLHVRRDRRLPATGARRRASSTSRRAPVRVDQLRRLPRALADLPDPHREPARARAQQDVRRCGSRSPSRSRSRCTTCSRTRSAAGSCCPGGRSSSPSPSAPRS